MKLKCLSLLVLFCSIAALGQNPQRSWFVVQNNAGFQKIVPFAPVTLCVYNSGLQCNTPVTIFSDPALTSPIAYPFYADANGYFSYYVAASTYVEKQCVPGGNCFTYQLTLSGGSGVIGGACGTTPFGVCANNSSRNATTSSPNLTFNPAGTGGLTGTAISTTSVIDASDPKWQNGPTATCTYAYDWMGVNDSACAWQNAEDYARETIPASCAINLLFCTAPTVRVPGDPSIGSTVQISCDVKTIGDGQGATFVHYMGGNSHDILSIRSQPDIYKPIPGFSCYGELDDMTLVADNTYLMQGSGVQYLNTTGFKTNNVKAIGGGGIAFNEVGNTERQGDNQNDTVEGWRISLVTQGDSDHWTGLEVDSPGTSTLPNNPTPYSWDINAINGVPPNSNWTLLQQLTSLAASGSTMTIHVTDAGGTGSTAGVSPLIAGQTFTIAGSTGATTTASVTGGTLTSNQATFLTSAQTLNPGQTVTVGSCATQTFLNGTYTVDTAFVGTLNANTFTVPVTHANTSITDTTCVATYSPLNGYWTVASTTPNSPTSGTYTITATAGISGSTAGATTVPVSGTAGLGATTTGSASFGSKNLTVASGTGTANGQWVTGSFIVPGSYVVSGGGTTAIVLSQQTSGGSGSVTFAASFRPTLLPNNNPASCGIILGGGSPYLEIKSIKTLSAGCGILALGGGTVDFPYGEAFTNGNSNPVPSNAPFVMNPTGSPWSGIGTSTLPASTDPATATGDTKGALVHVDNPPDVQYVSSPPIMRILCTDYILGSTAASVNCPGIQKGQYENVQAVGTSSGWSIVTRNVAGSTVDSYAWPANQWRIANTTNSQASIAMLHLNNVTDFSQHTGNYPWNLACIPGTQFSCGAVVVGNIPNGITSFSVAQNTANGYIGGQSGSVAMRGLFGGTGGTATEPEGTSIVTTGIGGYVEISGMPITTGSQSGQDVNLYLNGNFAQQAGSQPPFIYNDPSPDGSYPYLALNNLDTGQYVSYQSGSAYSTFLNLVNKYQDPLVGQTGFPNQSFGYQFANQFAWWDTGATPGAHAQNQWSFNGGPNNTNCGFDYSGEWSGTAYTHLFDVDCTGHVTYVSETAAITSGTISGLTSFAVNGGVEVNLGDPGNWIKRNTINGDTEIAAGAYILADNPITIYNAAAVGGGATDLWLETPWVTSGSPPPPKFRIEPNGTVSTSWNSAGTGMGVDAASGFIGNLMDLQVGGVSKASINYLGGIFGTSMTDSGLTSGNCVQASTGGLLTTTGGPCGASSVTGSGTTGYLPLWSSGTAIGNSHCDDGLTTASTVTCSEPLAVSGSGSQVGLTNAGLVTWGTDTGLTRDSAGLIDVGNGTAGNKTGSLNLAALTMSGALTLTGTGGITSGGFYTQTGGATNTLTGLLDANGGIAATNVAATSLSPARCASSASPAVCTTAVSGFVTIAAAASTIVVDTSAVTANSQILIQPDDTLGTALSVTCNTTLASLVVPVVTARTPGTSFTLTTTGTIATNPACYSFLLVN